MTILLVSFLLISVGLVPLDVYGQLKPTHEVPLEHLQFVAVDRLGNFYFLLSDHRLQRYSPEGTLQSETILQVPDVTLIEPWNPLKIFVYSHLEQAYRFYDRQLSLLETHAVDPSWSIEPLLMCPAQEVNKVWILDAEERVLKKVDQIALTIDLEAKLPITWNLTDTHYIFMRAYQNRLFLLDKKLGIHIFNNLGKWIATLPVRDLTYFNFLGEELCYHKGAEVLLFDIYTGLERKVANLEEGSPILFTLITDERLLVVTEQRATFYQYELKN